jgi:DNA mismatch repair ATPase MutS
VEITRDNLGLLLYGMNASGKSSYMKSIGLVLIMS